MRSDGAIDLEGMSGFQEWAIAKGLQVSPVLPEQLLDMRFVQYAIDALK